MTTVSKDNYYRLASDLEPERISAATILIKELSAVDNRKDWHYALSRLIKGLTSSRASARIGYSLCLAEILSILINDKHEYTIKEFLDDLNDELYDNSGKSSNGKNLRATLFGRLFGYQALINSNALQGHVEHILEVYDCLIEIALTKSWIREICFVTIYKGLKSLQLLDDEVVITALLKMIKNADLVLSPEGLLIYLAIDPAKRQFYSEKVGINSWKNGNPLSKGNMEILAKVLSDSEVGSADDQSHQSGNRQVGSWTPTLHYVWTPLLNELSSPEITTTTKKIKKHKHNKKEDNKVIEQISLTEFWKPVIDEQFFKLSASPERKYWGFEIFNLALSIPSLTQSQVSALLSANLLRSLINQSSKDNRMLHSLAKNTLRLLTETTKKYEERRIPILEKLLGTSLNFDKLTKSKTITDILNSCFSKQSLSDTIDYLTSVEVNSDYDIIKYQLLALDSLLKLVRSKREILSKSPELLKHVLNYLIEHTFLIKTSDPLRYTERMSKLSMERLYSVLSEAMSIQKNIDWTNYVIEYLMNFDHQINEVEVEDFEMRFKFEDSLTGLKSESINTLEAIKERLQNMKLDDPKTHLLNCFEILFSTALIELYTGDSESASILSDLTEAFGKASNIKSDRDENEQKKITEVLIDLMLTYINQRSTLMKKVAFTIWENLIEGIGESQLDRLFEILLTRENKQGQDKLFDPAMAEEEAEEEEEKEEVSSSSTEEPDSYANASVSSDLVVDETEASAFEDERRKKIEEVNENTTSALSKALRISENEMNSETDETNTAADANKGEKEENHEEKEDDEGEEDDDDDSHVTDSDDYESMSDEEMMALDSTLSQIFKQRREALQAIDGKSGNQRKLEAQEAREMMIFFKTRILDLLEIFIDERPTDSLNVNILLALINLMVLTMDKSVGVKAHKLVKKICKGKTELESERSALEALSKVQETAAHSKIQALTSACNHTCIFFTKNIEKQFGDKALDRVLDIYLKNFKKWLAHKSNKTTSGMFSDLVNWASSRRQEN
ncbi:hypothetical protein FOA43_003636 [Brettanomyces nanus]|uniref:DNA polymerase V n=1 Tax=Eeniella nana TaxID=13502 RepID=A0A875RQ94_EENNA|nr:uncharacterized protein FOA43_003636 [Brettanomyces nanus]QPG76250.1 hypothetical protein FOA43_003636 [Brettanomyces nanus]